MKLSTELHFGWDLYKSRMEDIVNREMEFPVFIIDEYFQDSGRIEVPLLSKDPSRVFYCNTEDGEPTTSHINDICYKLSKLPSIDGIVAIGGGSVMDIGKAAGVTYTNGGDSNQLQGWDLPKNKGLKVITVPTIPGTGAEVTKTAVLKGKTRKLGINSEFTRPTTTIIDPSFFSTVSIKVGVPTLLDCYIHCVEVLQGGHSGLFSKQAAKDVVNRFDEILKHPYDPADRDWAEAAAYCSYNGALSLLDGSVGACHALSYGISEAFNVRHSYANLLAFESLEDLYGDAVLRVKEYCERNRLDYWDEVRQDQKCYKGDVSVFVDGALRLDSLWKNALHAESCWQSAADNYVHNLADRLKEQRLTE